MRSFFCVSDVGPDFIAGTIIRVKDDGKIHAIDQKEFPYSKFPRNMSIQAGNCLELDYHGMMFSVKSASAQKFARITTEINITLKVTCDMIGENEEASAAKLNEFLKNNISMVLRPANSIDIEVISK